MLARDNATVSNGRLAAAGPAYKVLVIDSELQPATDPDKRSMPVATAERILGYAQSGLPVLIVGSPPDHVPGDRMEDDPVLKQVIAKLLAEPSVSRVDHEADVPAKLQALGILPSAQTATPGPLLSVRRHDEASGTDYYFLYDEGVVSPKGEPANLFAPATGAPLHTEVSLEGRGEPYLLDAWAGTMTPIAKFHTHGNRTIVDLDLVRDDATVIALSEHGHLLGVPEHPIYVVATSADGANRQGDALYVRAMQSGTYTTTLSNGRSVQSIARDVAGPLDLTAQHWKVSAEDWQPANPYSTTTGVAATETLKRALHFELQGLKPWSDIPELQYASGIAEYATTFDLPSQWSKSDGAILTLGSVSDSFELSVNGRKVPIDQLSAQADIGTDLKPGTNTLVVRVATTLNNRLAAIDPDVRARGLIQPYGLMGPVILRPYRQMQVFPLLSQPRQ
jgi:hypothetical protein